MLQRHGAEVGCRQLQGKVALSFDPYDPEHPRLLEVRLRDRLGLLLKPSDLRFWRKGPLFLQVITLLSVRSSWSACLF